MKSKEDYKYDDIIGLPHHTSRKRPRMSRGNRAAQFSPFAALTGYDAVIQETGRQTERRIELTEDGQSVLDRKNRFLMDRLADCPEVSVTYFVPDARKEGGAYVTATGCVKRIDCQKRVMILGNGTTIPLNEILELEGDYFEEWRRLEEQSQS